MYLADAYFRDPKEWERLKAMLESFGRSSGLFDEVSIKQLGRRESEPFQVHVRKYSGTRGKLKGPWRNLIDVGYGVSQALPAFGENRPPAGKAFFDSVDSGGMRLVIGGELLQELDKDTRFRTWRQQAVLAGRVRVLGADSIKARTDELRNEGACRSNDLHVLALAQVCGARLLFSNDLVLRDDFRNGELVNRPRGRIYSTRAGGQLRDSHRRLLRRTDLCRGRS